MLITTLYVDNNDDVLNVKTFSFETNINLCFFVLSPSYPGDDGRSRFGGTSGEGSESDH